MDFSINLTSAVTSSERRISPQWSLAYLQKRIELITGIAPEFQRILYYPKPSLNESVVIADGEATESRNVSDLGIIPYARLHVIDTNPDSNIPDMIDDTEQGFEYEMSEEDYQARSNTVLDWKRKQQLGRFNPDFVHVKERQEAENRAIAQKIPIGARCRVINISSERRGVVKFVGRIDILDKGEDTWVGIEFDEPVGKNDGSIAGVRIFECRNNHGSFVRPKQVEVGDFPELDPFGSDEEEM